MQKDHAMSGIGVQVLTAFFSAHLISDFLLQNEAIAVNKHRLWVLTLHAAGAGAAAYAACGLWRLWWIPLLTFVTHWILDRLKSKNPRQRLRIFLLDQGAHLAVAAGLAALVIFGTGETAVWPQLPDSGRRLLLRLLMITAALLLASKAGGILIELWVQPFLVRMRWEERKLGRRPRTDLGNRGGGVTVDSIRGLPNAGRIIGQLERLLIFILVFAGEPSAIGFLVAAKSIFRFGELRDASNRMEAEYILIGTLISFVYGVAVAYGARLTWNLI
ncbi:MAG: DUF3307 domain-containing protein [Desulfobacterales bacterium]